METDGFGNRSTVRITLSHASVKVSISEEYYIYTGYGVFGNIGGLIGVFLGLNLLSLADNILPKLNRYIKRTRRTKT